MRNLFFFLVIVSTSIFSKNYEIIENCCKLKILSPSLKNRETAKIKLNNGLIVYIISDPEIKESAAAMAVNAGSWNNPEEYPGMAHFTEHMLFQGTSLYPDRNDFIRFISDRKGNYNAFTTLDKTVYMFSINNDSFIDGLKRFSQFFISPLFDPSAIGSELYAVDQEHAKNIENDMRRMFQVWKETCNPKHPHHQFDTGNSATLSKIPRESLIKWYTENYHANAMRLIIYSTNSIEASIAMVSDLFQSVPKIEVKKESVVLPELSSSLQKGQFIYIKPVKDIQQIILQWELPKELAYDTTKSAQIVARAINASYPASLLNELKKENFVDELEAYVENLEKHTAFFTIVITLTDEGLSNRNKVIQKIFENLENHKEHKIPSCIFNELNTMTKINYEYQARTDAFDYVTTIASHIFEEDISTFPQKTLLSTDYNQTKIQQVLNCLTPETCQTFIIASPNKTGIEPNKKEKWAGVEYSIEPFPSTLLKILSSSTPNPNFESPKQNPFIPENLSITEEFSHNDAASPIQIFKNEYGIGYFIPQNFQTPKINWIFKIKTPAFDSSFRSYVLFDLFYRSLFDNLYDLRLQAKIAGIDSTIQIDEDAIIFQICGYSEKANLVLEKLLKKMKSSDLTKDQFDTYVKLYEQDWNNSKYNLPINQASEELSSILNKNIPTNEEKLKILNTLTFEEQKKFQSSVFDKTYIECIFTGNQSVKECETIWENVQAAISATPFETIGNNVRIVSLHEGPFMIEKKSNVLGSGIILAIDQNPFSFKKLAAQNILSQSIKEPFFSEMRSKQKTAYIAKSWNIEKRKHLFQLFAVQSGTISPHELLYRFEIFLDSFLADINKNINEERFNNIKENLISQWKIPPQNLDEMAVKYYRLAFYYKDFDFEKKRLQALSALSYEDFIELSKQFLSRNNKKRLSIMVEGNINESNNVNYKAISSKEVVNSFEYTPEFSLEEDIQ